MDHTSPMQPVDLFDSTPPIDLLDTAATDDNDILLIDQLRGDTPVTNCILCNASHERFCCPTLSGLPPDKQRDIILALVRSKRDGQSRPRPPSRPPPTRQVRQITSTPADDIDLLDFQAGRL